MSSQRTRQVGVLVGLALSGLGVACWSDPPRIAVGRTDLDLGVIGQQPVEAEVRIANVGRGTLRIVGIASSCDCTEAWVSDSVLASGAATTLTVRYSPTTTVPAASGSTQGAIYLRTNDVQRPQVRFRWHAVVRTAEMP